MFSVVAGVKLKVLLNDKIKKKTYLKAKDAYKIIIKNTGTLDYKSYILFKIHS